MNNYTLQKHKNSDSNTESPINHETRRQADCLASRLREAGLSTERGIPVERGGKATSVEEHQRPENQHDIRRFAEVSPGYAVHAGRGLLVVDVDNKEAAPDWVTDLPLTFVVKSPHGGCHLYYAIKNDDGIQNQKFDWGELRYGKWYVIGPGSILDHTQCDDGKENCPGKGYGTYDIEVDKPIATLDDDELDHIRKSVPKATGQKRPTESHRTIESLDKERAERETKWLCEEFLPKRAGQAAADELMDLLKGQINSPAWQREGSSSRIDRSKCDFHALSYLYGAFLTRGDDEKEARKNALAVFRHFCNENEYNDTGQPRKPLVRDDQYLADTMGDVQKNFDIRQWWRWCRREYEGGFDPDDQQPWLDPAKDGEPSDITEKTVLAAVWMLSVPVDLPVDDLAEMFAIDLRNVPDHTVNKCLPPARREASGNADGGEHPQRRYPTAKEVAELAAELNPDRSEEYFSDVVRQLTRQDTGPNAGRIAHAYCPSRPNGHRHVYYIAEGLEPPEDAKWVKLRGEKHDPVANSIGTSD